MTTQVHARAVAFMRDVARRQATLVTETAGGFAVCSPAYAASYDHNKIVFTGAVEPAQALRTTETVLASAGCDHRLAAFHDDEAGRACAPLFTAAGYTHQAEVIMYANGDEPSRCADPGIPVVPVGADALRTWALRDWLAMLPAASQVAIDQLVDRRTATMLAAETVTFLAVRAPSTDAETIAARADLYISGTTAQIEDLVTDASYRNRGYATAIVAEALRRAGAAGCDLVFLVADAEDWPARLYRRLGFAPAGRTHTFVRSAPKH